MDLVLLPGNSISNREWIEEVKTALEPNFNTSQIIYYDHWRTGDELIDLDREVDKLVKITKGLDNYIIFAKSAGCLLTLKGVYQGKINPEKCIFIGTPILWGPEHGFNGEKWLKEYKVPTLFIQKSNDPVITASDLHRLLNRLDIPNYQFQEISGDDHNYENIAQLKEFILNLLNKRLI